MDCKSEVSERVSHLLSLAKETKCVSDYKLRRKHNFGEELVNLINSESSLDSYRSYKSDDDSSVSSLGSDTSTYSRRSQLTLREKISILEKQNGSADDNNSLLSSSLHPKYLSWNKRLNRKNASSRPRINIIPCHQSTELILAKADERIKKQKHANVLKAKYCEDASKHIDKVIKDKQSRGERYATKLKWQQLQSDWIKIIFMIKYGFMSGRHSLNTLKYIRAIGFKVEAVKRIQRWYLSQYEKKIVSRYIKFLTKFRDVQWKVVLRLRIHQKRRALNIIKTSISEIKERKQVITLVWEHFNKSVRMMYNLLTKFLSVSNMSIVHGLHYTRHLDGHCSAQLLGKCTSTAKKHEEIFGV